MKLVSFRLGDRNSYGAIDGDAVRDLGQTLGADLPDLKSFLGSRRSAPASAVGGAPRVPFDAVELLPPIPNPSKIFCIGHNYEEHRSEMGRPKTTYPAVFLRFADSQVAHGQAAWIPSESTDVDFEGELAVVIGTGGRRIARAEALRHVAGYACYNDISVRDWQRHTTQFTPGKNFPRTGAFGPWLVSADEIADPQALELTTRLNGQVVQQSSTGLMIFPVAELIEYCSTFTPLSAGDVIISGTPGGVGVRRTPPLFMKPGDVVDVEISSVGTLRNPIVAEPRAEDRREYRVTR
jgi:2-keto-4-pentenoate hydratase/2-oxohepta-3-ene-1,7-dioic acid hydratase in catechol pathway